MRNAKENKAADVWKKHFADHAASGMTQKEYCRCNNLPLSKFYYYKSICLPKKKPQQAISGQFTPVSIAKPLPANDIRLILPNGFQCSFLSATDPLYVKKLIEVLLSC